MPDPSDRPFRYDFHLHSRSSNDCISTPRGIIDAALTAGLRGIAVTDHGTITGGLECRAIAPADLLVIVGAEIYTDVGDIVGLFLHSEIHSRDPLQVIADIHDQGGIAFLPHPSHGHPFIPEVVLQACDGYEILNARAGWFDPTTSGRTNWSVLEGKATFGCSDAHFASDIGVAYSMIAGPATEENVARQIRACTVSAKGELTPTYRFYMSQFVKMLKTRDPGMLLKLPKYLMRRIR